MATLLWTVCAAGYFLNHRLLYEC